MFDTTVRKIGLGDYTYEEQYDAHECLIQLLERLDLVIIHMKNNMMHMNVSYNC